VFVNFSSSFTHSRQFFLHLFTHTQYSLTHHTLAVIKRFLPEHTVRHVVLILPARAAVLLRSCFRFVVFSRSRAVPAPSAWLLPARQHAEDQPTDSDQPMCDQGDGWIDCQRYKVTWCIVTGSRKIVHQCRFWRWRSRHNDELTVVSESDSMAPPPHLTPYPSRPTRHPHQDNRWTVRRHMRLWNGWLYSASFDDRLSKNVVVDDNWRDVMTSDSFPVNLFSVMSLNSSYIYDAYAWSLVNVPSANLQPIYFTFELIMKRRLQFIWNSWRRNFRVILNLSKFRKSLISQHSVYICPVVELIHIFYLVYVLCERCMQFSREHKQIMRWLRDITEERLNKH